MQPHTKIYMKHFDYQEAEFIPCENCGRRAVDIHHIQGRGKGKDVIENLMAVCRNCHEYFHDSKIEKSTIQLIHNTFLAKHKPSYQCKT